MPNHTAAAQDLVNADNNSPPRENVYIEKDPDYFYELVYIRVENTLFRIPRQYLVSESEAFRSMFTLPQPDGTVEGMTEEHALVLHGINTTEFKDFLRVLTARLVSDIKWKGNKLRYAPSSWIPVLKLATMWQFDAIAKTALAYLRLEDATTRAMLARQYNIRGWLTKALWELSHRGYSLQHHEYVALGFDFAIQVVHLNERRWRNWPDRPAEWDEWIEEVKHIFGEDFAAWLTEDRKFNTS